MTNTNEQANFDAMISEGLNSGEPTEMTQDDWDDMRKRAMKRIKAKRKRSV